MDARRSLVSALYTLIVLCLCFVERGRGIKCYWCIPSPSVHGPEVCENLPKLSDDKKNHYLQDCSQNYTMCRKMYQDIAGDIRVFYGCASIGEIGCIKRAGTYKIKSTYCHCKDKDGCNSSPLEKAPRLPTILIAGFIASLISFGCCRDL